MGSFSKLETIVRGDVSIFTILREALLRGMRANNRRIERREVDTTGRMPARLATHFADKTPAELLSYFRTRSEPAFWPGDIWTRASVPVEEVDDLISRAKRITVDSSWELAGFGPLKFVKDNYWRCDPLGDKDWGTEYHADFVVYQDDGSDIRVLWELNRFGHAITLARAFAVTNDEVYADTFFSHVESWMRQNPYGRGANWNCTMEVALRGINLLAAFDIFRQSRACTADRLMQMLRLFDQHGRFILSNNEFSHLATSNHYLSNVVGLFWIGTLLPELEHSMKWREFGLSEMLREMDKQILPDGADFEASTGYHKFVSELFLYSFILAERSGIAIERINLEDLRRMLQYIRRIIRPDNRIPLIGDADGSQIIPIVKRDADDAVYLLSAGAIFLNDEELKTKDILSEVFWLFGDVGVSNLREMVNEEIMPSIAFPDAGAYVMRDGDLYLHFNANDCGVNGRGSHGHNDALSIEISAFGRPFIIDPGSYVYNLDREARHQFRSTAYHSTVMVDGEEQNLTISDSPFVLGNEARPTVTEWHNLAESDRVSAEHYGYRRMPDPVTHRRTIEFNKIDKYWIIEDEIAGEGAHEICFFFHISPGQAVVGVDPATVRIGDKNGCGLYIRANGIDAIPTTIPAFVSRNYGDREDCLILQWALTSSVPLTGRFIIVPSRAPEHDSSSLELITRVTDNISN